MEKSRDLGLLKTLDPDTSQFAHAAPYSPRTATMQKQQNFNNAVFNFLGIEGVTTLLLNLASKCSPTTELAEENVAEAFRDSFFALVKQFPLNPKP